MLWNVVYEFFIQYIFGGTLFKDNAIQTYNSIIGVLFDTQGNRAIFTTSLIKTIPFTNIDTGITYYLSLGNYLSLIATIITMVVILVLCCMFIKKIYNMCAHIIG